MLTILLKFNDELIKTIETDKEVITIGRNESNDIQVDNLSVSKQHAAISKEDDKYIIEDLKSTNGTYLNENNISRAELADHDLITIGKHSLEINLNRQTGGGKNIINDTMLLKTEKHKKMLKKQQ